MAQQAGLPPREAMEFDCVIVGAGPSGLAAAIRLKQLAAASGKDISVVVLEKGSEVGAHILSGAVIDPVGLNRLIPEWREKGAPVDTPVTEDRFLVLGPAGEVRLPNWPMPPMMKNHGNYIVSLGALCKWLGEQATELGVEIYPGFAAVEALYNNRGAVVGVATGDMGIGRDGKPKDSFVRGMELRGKYTLIGEGARGSLTKMLIKKFELDRGHEPQKYGIGIKELWQVAPEKHQRGLVQHSFGWPLDNRTGGGSFLYHYGENLVAVGFVVHLNYENPYLSPYEEFQRFKTHPEIRKFLEGGKRIAYGARAIAAGGLQSLPKLTFPGGVLVGDDAGFLNASRIKGSHCAIKSGALAAEACFEALAAERERDELTAFPQKFEQSWLYDELYRARNFKPWMAKGMQLGGLMFGIDQILFRGKAPWTLHHSGPDHAKLKPASQFQPINYPKPDGIVSFDRLSSVFLSSTNHEEDQPCHLTLKDASVPIRINLAEYDAPEQRYCPAGVYEIVRDEAGQNPRLQINAQNCVHCKTCDIKDPTQNINWVVPQGGEGPTYPNM